MMRSKLVLLLACTTLLANAVGASREYEGSSVVVVRDSDGNATFVDSGVFVCRPEPHVSFGGACLPFAAGVNAVEVVDEELGARVAFSVCVDNDGDGRCGAQDPAAPCQDFTARSHDDGGVFINPLGPLPTGFEPGCPGGYPGYLVFVCSGVHDDETGSHAHRASRGTVSTASVPPGPPTAGGNYCEPPPLSRCPPVCTGITEPKAYVIEPYAFGVGDLYVTGRGGVFQETNGVDGLQETAEDHPADAAILCDYCEPPSCDASAQADLAGVGSVVVSDGDAYVYAESNGEAGTQRGGRSAAMQKDGCGGGGSDPDALVASTALP